MARRPAGTRAAAGRLLLNIIDVIRPDQCALMREGEGARGEMGEAPGFFRRRYLGPPSPTRLAEATGGRRWMLSLPLPPSPPLNPPR